jgi:hypothetical protein
VVLSPILYSIRSAEPADAPINQEFLISMGLIPMSSADSSSQQLSAANPHEPRFVLEHIHEITEQCLNVVLQLRILIGRDQEAGLSIRTCPRDG